MDTLPLRQAKTQTSQSQRPRISKVGQSHTTIDLYLRPTAKVKQGQNDIRKYFPPVAETNVISNVENSISGSPVKTPAPSKLNYDDNGATKCQTSALGARPKSPADNIISIPENRKSGYRAPDIFLQPPNHNHAKSAVLPRFDPFFDSEQFPHSTSPMAPRVNEVVRHSLVPKPLNIKMHPPAAETSRSPSQTTSSPSSVGDPDTASLDGEGREAPSYKQTYLSVHSRQHTNDSPVSPLTALRDPSSKPLRQRTNRPAILRSNTAPKLIESYSSDSVIYFLPKISPSSESSADEREPLMRTSYQKPIEKASIRDIFKAKRQAVKFEGVISAQIDTRKEALKEKTVAASPGMRTHFALTAKICY